MKHRWQKIIVFAGSTLLAATAAHANQGHQARGISVQGQAEIRVVPDRAELAVAVEVENTDADAASEAANSAAARFVRAARKLGADERSIQSASLRLSPEYRWDEEHKQREQVGYRARRDITVEVTELDRLGQYLSAATEAGMTHIAPPRLYAAQAKTHQREALRQAMADARANADAIADAADRKVGEVISVDARDEQRQPVEPRAMMLSVSDRAENQGNEGFSAGEIVYSARLRARFAFAP